MAKKEIKDRIKLLITQAEEIQGSLQDGAKTSSLQAKSAMDFVQIPESTLNTPCNYCLKELQNVKEFVKDLQQQLVSAGVIETLVFQE